MRKLVFLLLIAGATISILSTAHAQKKDSLFLKLEPGLTDVNNPFLPQLPIIEKKKNTKPAVNTPIEPIEDPVFQIPLQQGTVTQESSAVPPEAIPEKPVPSVTINGIIWNSDRPQAIINGDIFDIGDTILEIKITNIQKTGITGLFYGREITLQP